MNCLNRKENDKIFMIPKSLVKKHSGWSAFLVGNEEEVCNLTVDDIRAMRNDIQGCALMITSLRVTRF